jgi:hypothetical protein
VVPIALHKGSDFDLHVDLVQRLLRHEPLYVAPPPDFGTWWPPFPLVALVPFAWLACVSAPLAKAAFAVANVAALAFAVTRARADFGPMALAAVAAVAVPLQTNFEYLNLNAPLLALLLLGAGDLSAGREQRAGLWIGLMTALKAFPGLLLALLAWRREWRAVAVAVTVALTVTLVSTTVLAGPAAALGTLRRWSAVSLAAVPEMRGRSQSLPALLFRLGVPLPWQGALEVAALAVVLVTMARRGPDPQAGLAAMMVLAVLLSPVAHTHYYLLAYPAWCVLLTRRPPPSVRRVVWCGALGVAAVLTSGFLTLGAYAWRRSLHDTGIYAWGGAAVLLLTLLVLERPRQVAASPP